MVKAGMPLNPSILIDIIDDDSDAYYIVVAGAAGGIGQVRHCPVIATCLKRHS